MWHKAEWMGRPTRLELNRVGFLVYLSNRYTTRGAIVCQLYFTIYKSERVPNGPRDQGSIPGRVILMTQKNDAWSLLALYVLDQKEKPREKSCAQPYIL